MTEPIQPLVPALGGIAHRLIDASTIYLNPLAWQRAHEAREIVGTCRRTGCVGKLRTLPTHQAGPITWYGAVCDTCGGEISSPSARILSRSGRHHQMPEGWWDRRTSHLRRIAAHVRDGGQ